MSGALTSRRSETGIFGHIVFSLFSAGPNPLIGLAMNGGGENFFLLQLWLFKTRHILNALRGKVDGSAGHIPFKDPSYI